MKKLCITIALALSLTFAACDANEEPKVTPEGAGTSNAGDIFVVGC